MRITTYILRCLGAFALLAMLVVAGCDSNGESDSDFAVFTQGSWNVQRLAWRNDGGSSFNDITTRLYGEYESVIFTFADNDTQGRRFELFLGRSGDGADRSIVGDVDIDGSDDAIVLIPEGTSLDLFLDYEIEGADRIVLRAEEQDGSGLIEQLFANNTYGEFIDVEIVFGRGAPSAN